LGVAFLDDVAQDVIAAMGVQDDQRGQAGTGNGDGITITANHGGRSLHLEVNGSVPIDAVSDFMTAALGTASVEPEAEQGS
jgi:hypothetical protein